MGTYVLSICLLNFIAGFAAAMYMHNPRLLRIRRRKKESVEVAPVDMGEDFVVADSPVVGLAEWSLPESWREALVHAKLTTDASPDTVLHGLLYWQNEYRDRMLQCEQRLRAADEAERVDESLLPVLEKIAVTNRDFVSRLRESSKLLQALRFNERDILDDRIHDLIFDIEPACSDVEEEEVLRELKTSGVRNYISEARRVIDSGHPFRDFVEMLIAERLFESGNLSDVPESWLRHSDSELRNRIGFVQTLYQFFENETEPFQIITFHLDRFRQINERLGVAEGDVLLQAFVALLRDLLPGEDIDTRMARLFGATAIVFLPKTHRNGAEVTAERIRQAIEASSIELPSGPIECTISCTIIEAFERQTPSQLINRISPIIMLINKAGGNRTGAESEGVPEVIEPRAFQVEARVVRNGVVEHVASLEAAV